MRKKYDTKYKENMMRKKKKSQNLQELISRSEYLVVQGNDLAKSFGNLKAFEHRVLDYCFSFVKKESLPSEIFVINIFNLLKFLNLTSSGTNYKRVVQAFETLNKETALYLPGFNSNGKKKLRFTKLFDFIDIDEEGGIEFQFSMSAQPYIFDLKKNFYSFHLRELANIKGKYSLILLKLWESHRHGNSKITIITGNLEEWQNWFIGKERRLPAGRFAYEVITRAAEEIEEKFPVQIILTTQKKGRTVVGYEMEILDYRKPTQVEINKAIDKHERGEISFEEMQTTIYDFLD